MEIKVIIPCHLGSVRLKEKVIIDINGLPMIEHVRRRVLLSKNVDEVFIATNDNLIKDLVESFGGKVIVTKGDHNTGTSRAAEAITNIECSHVILVQGDEPLLIPEYLDLFISELRKSEDIAMFNAISRFKNIAYLDDTSIVKCLINKKKNIITCFRESPFSNMEKFKAENEVFKIQGLIAYKKKFLLNLINYVDTPFAIRESIEQMKAIEHGAIIKGIFIPEPLASVNTKKELDEVKRLLLTDKKQIELFNKIKQK